MKVSEVADANRVLTVDEQVAHLRARTAQQEREIRRLSEVVGGQREIKQALVEAVIACEPYKRVAWKAPSKPGKPVIPVLKLSDWHIGEVINPAETEGFGRYDWEIAQRRIFGIVTDFLRWVEMMRTCYRIDECRVFREGDLTSGNIHHELEVTNEFPAPVATAKAGFLLGEVVARIAPHFANVIVEGVDADNHGRLNTKPQAKQKAHNNWCYLAAVVAAESLKKHKNVEFRFTPGMKYLANVGGQDFLVEHGDGVKSWMGIPFYGLERERARESTRRMNTDRTFNYMSISHWHVPGWFSDNILVNGSLSGTTEFDHSCGRHAHPAQVSFLVHPERGVFNFMRWRAEL